ncbi:MULTISPECIES: hypothetical protein [unclassified Novosphingobium]|uniref:hypothetical protein n=1 Tax=unclassified Novosphingobium TaxID=2644732 RepID=UPI0025F1B818|nr:MULTISPECIES: hypothetical protein [unclassified Novosphingobium]HQV04664.1 hypothetical protein [Novosphingobium sp.]
MSKAFAIYSEAFADTHAFYREHHQGLCDRGYYLMYGPLLDAPPILFVGYQPGGDQTDPELHLREPVHDLPAVSYYATDDWKLAVVMRKLWGRELMAASTGLNAIFFRSPRVSVFEREVASPLRRRIEAHCLPIVEALVEAMEPRLVVAIGFRTLELFGPTLPALSSPNGRVLVRSGRIGKHQAIGTLHLSGARISAVDLSAIGSFVMDNLAQAGSA